MNNTVFGKTMENLRIHRDINFIKTERRRNYLVSEPIIILQSFSYYKVYHATKFDYRNEKN